MEPRTWIGRKTIMIGALLAAMLSIFGFISYMADSPYRTAFNYEVIEVAGQTLGNAIELKQMQLHSVQKDIWAVEDRIEQLKAERRNYQGLKERLRDLQISQDNLLRESRSLAVKLQGGMK